MATVQGLVTAQSPTPLESNTGTSYPRADASFLEKSKFGIFTHFLFAPKDIGLVDKYDVQAVANQLDKMGAGYLILTLGQNSGTFLSPNATYDQITGYAPGERCSKRDLPLELSAELAKHGIKLMLYLPSEAPNGDALAQKAFGLAQGEAIPHMDVAFAQKWALVIQEWSDRYGDKISGWWFDGAYDGTHKSGFNADFNSEIGDIYNQAAKHGNTNSIVAFNPGAVGPVFHVPAEDYTAGEANNPFDFVPSDQFVQGLQWHVLTFMGNFWKQPDVRFPADQWIAWLKKVKAHQGAVTLDIAPNMNDEAGHPVGTYNDAQMAEVIQIKDALN